MTRVQERVIESNLRKAIGGNRSRLSFATLHME